MSADRLEKKAKKVEEKFKAVYGPSGAKKILPFFRYALTGERKGPNLFKLIAFLGPEECKRRIKETCG